MKKHQITGLIVLLLLALLFNNCSVDDGCGHSPNVIDLYFTMIDFHSGKPISGRQITLKRDAFSNFRDIIVEKKSDSLGRLMERITYDFFPCSGSNSFTLSVKDDSLYFYKSNSGNASSYFGGGSYIERLHFYAATRIKLRLQNPDSIRKKIVLGFGANAEYGRDTYFSKIFDAKSPFDSTFIFPVPILSDVYVNYSVSINDKTTTFTEKIVTPNADSLLHVIKF